MLMTGEGECFSCLPGGERSVQVRHVTPALADQIWNWCRAERILHSMSDRLHSRPAERLPDLIAEHPNLARIFFAPGLLIELFFFLGLLGRRWSAGMGLAAIGLHRSIELVMGLRFASCRLRDLHNPVKSRARIATS